MTSPQESALVYIQALLRQWGLESLDSVVRDMLTAGDSPDTVPIKLRETPEYKTRFAGNAARIKAGMGALSEAEYLATEASLKTVVRRYVGSGTYDTRENLEQWIGSDVSPQELNTRMQDYQDNFLRQPQWVRDAWAANGFTPADAIKAVIDPNVTETSLRRQLGIYGLGSEAIQAYRDSNTLDQERLGRLADAGVTGDKAREAFGDIAAREQYESFLARTAGTDLSRQEQEDAELLNDERAGQKRRKVLSTAQAQFEENYLGGVTALRRSPAGQNY